MVLKTCNYLLKYNCYSKDDQGMILWLNPYLKDVEVLYVVFWIKSNF